MTRQLRILFVVRAFNFDRTFEGFLVALLERGHRVELLVTGEKRGTIRDPRQLFDTLVERFATFSYEMLPPRSERWLTLATPLRNAIDYLRYLDPRYESALALRDRARVRAPRTVRGLASAPLVGRRGAGALARGLRAVERALPLADDLVELMRARRPDIVLVSPMITFGSPQVDHVRAARSLGIPTALLVASWDNLTNKGLVKEVPDLTLVWNQAQVDEAVELHGIPRERVVATGAHTFDHWFTWTPSTTRDEFAARLGLDPARPLLLYVGSSAFIARGEVEFVEEWIRRLRSSPYEELRSASVVVRPHPQNAVPWEDVDFGDAAVVIWPRGGAQPRDVQRKSEYYDSLYHSSAVVGVNTSALIEAAIVRRPVFTLLDDRFRDTQEGTLHFAHLAGDAGVLNKARSWEEHHEQLRRAVVAPDSYLPQLERFLTTFVRPRGLDVVAADVAVEALERAAVAPALELSPPHAAGRAAVAAAMAATAGWRLLEAPYPRKGVYRRVRAVSRRTLWFGRALVRSPRATTTRQIERLPGRVRAAAALVNADARRERAGAARVD